MAMGFLWVMFGGLGVLAVAAVMVQKGKLGTWKHGY